MSKVNINNLRSYLNGIVANQVKTTQPSYANQVSLVNAVTSTSQYMNINPKTGTIVIIPATGTTPAVTVPQPVITPLTINSTTAFVSTINNQVSVTSKGEEDTIITSTIANVNSITSLNTGSNTLNNTLNNINDSVSTNFWNPQRNEDQVVNNYLNRPYILNYTFSGANTLFKVFVKNLAPDTYTFPGFNTIKIYPTNTPSNFVTITPSINILDGNYNNQTIALLLDSSSTPYFQNVNKLTLEIDMNPYTKPNTASYQFGPNTGIIYNTLLNEGKYQTAVVNGGYIYRSEDYGDSWSSVTTYSQNWSSVSVSSSGQYQTAVVNGEYIYRSSNYGVDWSPITTYSKNWTAVSVSSNGQYQTAIVNGEYIYRSSDYGVTWTQLASQGTNNWTAITMSENANYQYVTVNNGNIYSSTDYGVTWSSISTSPVKNWSSISVSADGSILNAVTSNEYRYNSQDYGVTWITGTQTNYFDSSGNYVNTTNPQNWTSICNNSGGVYTVFSINGNELFNSVNLIKNAYARNGYSTLYWTSVNCSYSAKYVSACALNSVIYKSTDYGFTWTATQSPSLNWSSISISKGYNDTYSTVSLKAGDYISYNTATGTIDQWTSPLFVDNYSTLTGTDVTGNKNFMSSSDGNIQVSSTTVYASKSYYSNNGGTTWKAQAGSSEYGTDDMVISEDGQFSLYTKNGVYGSYTSQLRMSNNFVRSREINYSIQFINESDQVYCNMSKNGKYQFFIGNYTGIGPYIGNNYFFYDKNYNSINGITEWSGPISFAIGSNTLTYVGSFVYMNGDLKLIYNINNTITPILINFTASSDYSIDSSTVTVLTSNTTVYSFGTNNNKDISIDSKYITLIGWNSSTSQPIVYTINNGTTTSINLTVVDPSDETPYNINNTAVKISSTGQYQVITFTYRYDFDGYTPSCIYYSSNYGATWTKTSQYYNLNVLKAKQPFVANDDFSYITLCGGFASRTGSGVEPSYEYITPCTYYSLDRGQTWTFNSSINPATQFQLIAFYYTSTVTNKTYFQIKDTNQSQVLGVSDNGFKMVKDLRVTNANGYVIGGTMTIGPDETSSLLNNYSLNVDGTISCRNVVTLSDKRFKNVVGSVSDKDSYDKISKLDIINYKYIDRTNDDRIYAGMIAQDVYDVFNDAVDIRNSTYMNNEGTVKIPDIYSIKYNVINSYLISAFKYSQQYINKIEKECDNLKNELNTIKLALNLNTGTNTDNIHIDETVL